MPDGGRASVTACHVRDLLTVLTVAAMLLLFVLNDPPSIDFHLVVQGRPDKSTDGSNPAMLYVDDKRVTREPPPTLPTPPTDRQPPKHPMRMDFDKYHACERTDHGKVKMPDPPQDFNATGYLDDPDLIDAAKFKVIPHPEPKRYASLDEIPGRVAVVTVVGRTNSPRYQDGDPKADQLPCALIMQYLSIKEQGKIPFGNGKFDYVVIMSDEGTPTEKKLLGRYGIRIVTMPMPSEDRYDNPFERGAMMKAHGIALAEYDRILLLDGDMFAKRSIEDHFLLEFQEDMVTTVHSSSPCAGNWIILRPNREVYKKVWDIAERRIFSLDRGWNDTGLFTWPEAREEGLPCHAGWVNSGSCRVNDVWVARCDKHRVTNWAWMGSNEVQGFYPWVYNISGLGTSLYLGSREVAGNYGASLGQGAPWWVHYQGGTKPWIMSGRSIETCPGQKFHEAVKWFWHEFFPAIPASYGIRDACPSYVEARKQFDKNAGCPE